MQSRWSAAQVLPLRLLPLRATLHALSNGTSHPDITVTSTARYVVEQLPPGERGRAVVRTPTKSLFIEETEALYEQPEFPKPLA